MDSEREAQEAFSPNNEQRKMQFLRKLQQACYACVMCEYGWDFCQEKGKSFKPQIFSNMNYSQWLVCGQNPGFEECQRGEPFVGQAGSNFDKEIAKHGLDRSWFYISNAVKCHTISNAKPTEKSMKACEPFLKSEIEILKIKMVLTLGAVPFSVFCPGKVYSECLGKTTVSEKFGVKVFPIYHPSPRNLYLTDRRKKFEKDVALISRAIKKLNENIQK